MRKLVLLFIAFLAVGCAGAPDPTTLDVLPLDSDVVERQQSCEHFYTTSSQIVAVTTFANNSSYQNGDYKSSSSVASTSISPGQVIGFAASSVMERYIAPQLGEYAQSTLETVLVNMGGPKVVTRSQMEAVLKEQQFQMTLADPSTIVDFGMLMGAQYIVTGSVDNIMVEYTAPVNDRVSTDSTLGLIMGLGSKLYNVAASGWDVSTRFTVSIIDVSTGEILGTRANEGSANVGDAATLSMDQVIAGAKKAMAEDMEDMMDFLNDQFETRVYINELRGGKQMVRLSAGSAQGLKPGDEFTVVNTVNQLDFLSNSNSCVLSPTDITLTVTEYMTQDSAWALVDTSNARKLEQVKIGSIARRSSVKR
ncbi:MAG: hypothetical protein LBV04_02840 [Deferribacteraceae bacterium]|jgi:curli biogenesis system outer membrane secretion channel CsgG|nr:hypothetical protein [Deferribacteraceae bacterium]